MDILELTAAAASVKASICDVLGAVKVTDLEALIPNLQGDSPNEVRVMRANLTVSGFSTGAAGNPNGTYTWYPALGRFMKNGDTDSFYIIKTHSWEQCTWRLYHGSTQVAYRVDFELPGEFTVLEPGYGTYGTVVQGAKTQVSQATLTNISAIINEACYGDIILLSRGLYIYNGCPWVNDTPDAVGNHRYLVGDLTIVSLAYRAATIKFVQGSATNLMTQGGGSVRMFYGGGRMRLIDLVLDTNTHENVTTWWGPEGWEWGGDNEGLNPFYGPFALYGNGSLVKGCHLINWTAGGTNVPLGNPEHSPISFFGYNCIMDSCLVDSPADVSYLGRPYVTVISSRFGCRYQYNEVNLPDTHDDYWYMEGSEYTGGFTGTFAFGCNDGTVFIGNTSRNFVKMFHRDTVSITNCVIIGNSCTQCRYGVNFQLAGKTCRNVYIAFNQFSVHNRGTDSAGCVDILPYDAGTPTVMTGITVEHNTFIGQTTTAEGYTIVSHGVMIGNENHAATGVVVRNNTSGFWDNESDRYGRQIVGALDNYLNGVNVGPNNFVSEPLALLQGGTGGTTAPVARTNLGLDYLIAPSTEPPIYGAVWNNGGTLAISSGAAETTAYILAVESRLGANVPSTKRAAIDKFVRAEIAAGRWTKHKRIYLPVWGQGSANTVSIVNPASTGTWHGTITHSAGYVQGNGSNGSYLDSGANAATLGLTLTSAYLFALTYLAPSNWFCTAVGAGHDNAEFFLRSTDPGGGVQGTFVYGGGILESPVLSTGILSFARENGYKTLSRRTAYGKTELSRVHDLDVGNAALPTEAVAFLGNNTNGSTVVQCSNAGLGVFGVSSGLTPAEDADFTANLKEMWEAVTGLVMP